MTMSDDKLEKTFELSSIYDELRSTTQQRGQELQSISQLLEGIRQLQAAQQDDDVIIDEDAGQALDGAVACNTAAEQLQHLQQALLLQSERAQAAPANGTRDLGAGKTTGRTAGAAAAVLATADEQTWPQTALVQLFSEAQNSGSTKGNVVCGASSGSSSSPSSRMTAQQTSAQGQHQQNGQALSMFSFAAGATPAGLKYTTPVKIPRPVRPRSTRCSNIDSNSGDSSSIESSCSRQGSYAGNFYRGDDKTFLFTGPATAEDASGAATRTHSNSNLQQLASPAAHPAAAGTTQQSDAWQPSSRPSPRLTPTSSMSTEAAALMMALRAAAQQRETAQEVLQARSSIATTGMTHGTLTPRGASVDSACSVHRNGNPDSTEQRKVLQDVCNLVTPPAAAAACNKTVVGGEKEVRQEQQQGAQHKQQQGAVRAWSPGSASPTQQHSIVGPRAEHSSSSNSVYRSQRAAVDRLMQEAVESSSMSSLMALLDSQAVSEDEEVADTAAGAAVAMPYAVVGPAGLKVSAAHTWGTNSVSGAGSNGNCSCSNPQTGAEAAGRTAGNSWSSLQPQGGQLHQQYLSQQQQQQQQQDRNQQPHEKHRYTPDSRANSALSGGTSELQYDVLSAELEMLSSQVEQERQQLQQLQHQRQMIEQESPQTAGATASQVAPQHRQQLQQGWPLEDHRSNSLTGWRQPKQALRRSRSCGHLSVATAADCQSVLHSAVGPQQAASFQITTAADHRRYCPTAHAHVQTEAAVSQSVSAPDNDASTQAGGGVTETTAGPATVDVGCQALLLHVSGLTAVGPPPTCRVCPDMQQQLTQLQQKLEKAQEQHTQAQMSAEQSRHQAMIAESQLALSRQKLRAVLSANAKPLAMSGWEDLIEEAAADLEKIEGYVSTAAERLIELQAASTSAAEALVSAQRENERQHVAAATAALKSIELQQQAEGLVAAISSNEHCKARSDQRLQILQQQVEQHQAAATAVKQQLHELQQQLQEAQQQVVAAEQQLTEMERGQQQLTAELSEKQHQLQITRGECASAQDRLSQLQTSLVEARQQLADLQQQHQQQQRQHEETGKQLTTLQAQRTGAGAEAASAQQELDRVLRELEQCQKDIQAAELQQAELDEATAEQQRLQEQHSKAAAAAAKQREKLEADVAAAQEGLKQLQQQGQAAKYEADLCTSAAAAADRQLAQVQQTLGALQAGSAHAAGHRPAAVDDASTTAASAAAAATAHLAESAQLQVKLAASESRRQLAEERAEQSDRRMQQLKSELSNLNGQHDSAERQLRQVTVKCEKLKEKLKEKCESLTDVQNQLQQAQMQSQILRQTAAAAAAGPAAQQDARAQQQHTADSQAIAAVAAQAEAQKLIHTYQQRLGELEADVTCARTQLQQAEQQLDQQRQANSSLQQQLTTAQQQLVHAQQQLLEVRSHHSAGALSQQHQADQMHLAVRSSIQGLHEAFGLQAKLQHAQMQAESAKQQLQESQQERKQLQKKLVAYKQQLTELKSVYDSQQMLLQQQQHQTSSADSTHGPVSGSSVAAGQLEELKLQLKQQQAALSSEIDGVQQQLADCQHQLQWANREAEHLKQLLNQQQEISSQLRTEVQRLHLQQPQGRDATRLVLQSQACQTVVEYDSHCDGSTAAAAEDAASQLQQMQTELAAATQQLAEAKVEAAAAQQKLRNVQQRLQSMEHSQQQQVQQHAQQLANAQQQLHQKEAEVSAKAQQLVQQQQEHKWQQVQWEQKLQVAEQQAGQELLECRAELANSQTALQQLLAAAVALERQLMAAVEGSQQNAAGLAALDTSTIYNSGPRHQAQVGAASGCVDDQPAQALAHAAHLVKYLTGVCTTALDAKVSLQQQLDKQQKQAQQQLQQVNESHSSQLQQLVKAVEAAEAHRQEAELLQLQLEQECQLLRLQQQQQQQDKQTQLPGHMQSVASVLDVMAQLHAVTQQSLSSAAAWGTSSCGVLRGSAVPQGSGAGTGAVPAAVAVTDAGATTLNSPAGTPQMSLEALEGLLPPASCLSPRIPTEYASAKDGALRPTAARGLQYGSSSGVTDPVAAAVVPQPRSQAAVEAAELHQRLVRLIQGIVPQLQNPETLQQHGSNAPCTARSLQQPPVVVRSSSAAAAGLAGVVLADAELQKSWQSLQEQAAGHEKLMQHMKHMWLQVVTLVQHCIALQQVTTGTEEIQKQHTTQQQHQVASAAPLSQSAAPKADNDLGSSDMQQVLHASTHGSPAQPAAPPEVVQTLRASMQPLLVLAQQLQQEVTEIENDNKQLLEAAKKLCSSFRSAGRTVRVRALALKLDLQQHGHPEGIDVDGAPKATANAAATAAGTDSGLPTDVAVAVIQHWNEVETLLAHLHQACEALLQQQPVAAGKQQQKQLDRVSGSSGSSTRRHAVRRCKRLVDDLQRFVLLCQQQQQPHQQQVVPATQQQAVQSERHSSPAVVARLSIDAGQEQRSSSCGADSRSRSRSPEAQQQQAAAGFPLQHICSARQQTHQAQPQQQEQKEQHSLSLLPLSSPSCSSSCSSDGLSSLLAMVKDRLAAQSAASTRQGSPFEGSGVIHGKQGNSRQKHQHAVGSENREPRLAAAAFQVPAVIHPSSATPVKGAGQEQLTQHVSQLARPPAGPVQSNTMGHTVGKQGSSWAHAEVRTSASLRRTERVILMERLKLLQQQQ